MSHFGSSLNSGRTLQECSRIVEEFLRNSGLDPGSQRLNRQDATGWFVRRGSALVYILLIERKSVATFRILSPLVCVPRQNLLTFYRRLLELNVGLLNCALGIEGEVVFLVHERSTTGLDADEIEQNIRTFAAYADALDDALAREFQALLFSGPGEPPTTEGAAPPDYPRGFPFILGGELRRTLGQRPSFHFEYRVDPDALAEGLRRELRAANWDLEDDIIPGMSGHRWLSVRGGQSVYVTCKPSFTAGFKTTLLITDTSGLPVR